MRNRYIYKIGSRVCIMLALCCWQGCTSGEAPVDRVDPPQPPVVNNGRVAVDLALSISTTKGNTRMASSDVNPTSLDIDGFNIIPFSIPSDQDSIRSTDASVMDAVTGFATSGKHYLSDNQELNIGINAFLCYAKAKHAEPYSETSHGSLNATGSGLSSKFTLKPITKPTASEVIVNYMNSIAGASGWNSSAEAIESFNSFVNSKGGPYHGLAGSSKNIIAYVNEWLDKSIPEAIKTVIRSGSYVTLDNNNKVTAIVGVTDYPGIFPDGSAVIKWDGTKFAYESFPDYAYPAERYFYANSRIVTSNASQSTHYENEWPAVVSNYTDGDVVASTTQSVAIKNPLRYGVAGMEIHIKANAAMLGVYNGEPVTLTSTMFPLTAVIVGSQVEQNCFFEPNDPTNQEEKEYLIYDTKTEVVKPSKETPEYVYLGETGPETLSLPVYTLGLQTKDDVSLKVVLEFENNSGAAFISENGVIYPGTKFYMVASVVPPGTGEIGKRVMTRGHMTVVNLTIGSLKTAYNALPDLSSDKLRLFDVVEAGIREWKPGQTGEHEVYNW